MQVTGKNNGSLRVNSCFNYLTRVYLYRIISNIYFLCIFALLSNQGSTFLQANFNLPLMKKPFKVQKLSLALATKTPYFVLSEAVVQRCPVKQVFLKISKNSQESTCVRVSFLIKLLFSPAILLKRRLWHTCFPVNFVKFLRTPFFIEHLWWMLLSL